MSHPCTATSCSGVRAGLYPVPLLADDGCSVSDQDRASLDVSQHRNELWKELGSGGLERLQGGGADEAYEQIGVSASQALQSTALYIAVSKSVAWPTQRACVFACRASSGSWRMRFPRAAGNGTSV